jgi:hypothetical protein
VRSFVFQVVLLSIAVGTTTNQVRFKASTALVRLEVSVTDDRGSVRGLTSSDFLLDDRGVRQTVRVAEFNDAALDVVLVAPPVSTVAFIAAGQTFRFGLGVKASIEQVQERDRLGIVLASAPPRRLRPLDVGRPLLDLKLFSEGTDYYSASYDAIAMGLRVFEPSSRRQALIAFTNAADFRSVIGVNAVTELASRLGPAFVLVATPVTIQQSVTGFVDERESGNTIIGTVAGSILPAALEQLARKSGGVAINLGDGDPRLLMERLFTSLRTGYVLTYELANAKGWHPIKLRVNRRGTKVAVREGYFVD